MNEPNTEDFVRTKSKKWPPRSWEAQSVITATTTLRLKRHHSVMTESFVMNNPLAAPTYW